ncbi:MULTISPECIES: helix-turn-helix domain-containing protein [unclassified Clostridium]|uniref:helix-turn-helix domain-containing protein n=1 Tax=unclassified Clostridium TaxID=2614128 RepID=UPI003F902E56
MIFYLYKGVLNIEICERLQKFCKLSNYPQEQLANMISVSRQAISKGESGQANPDITNIIKLSEIYNVSCDYILIGKTSAEKEIEYKPHLKKHNDDFNKALAKISIIGATALITVLFIMALGFLGKLYLSK